MNEVLYAGFWRRVVSIVIDMFVLWIPGSIVRLSAPYFGITGIPLEIVDFIYVILLWSLYYGFTESSRYQATLGKRIMGLKVTNYDGEKISFWNAVGRFLAQFIALLPLGIGILMIGWTKKKQGIHDMMAKCLAIRKQAINP